MGFGGKQALQAGIEGFSVSTTADMNARLRSSKELKKLEDFLGEHPSLRSKAIELMRAQLAERPIVFPQLILAELRRSIVKKTKPHIDRRGR
jgi:hypothetical protein